MSFNSPEQYQPHDTQPRMTRYQVMDEQQGGLVVSTFMHPCGWRAGSQVMWNTQHTNLPVLVHAATFNPNGMEAFEFLPTQAFYWLAGDYGQVPIGQNAHGLVRMPPRPAPDALATLVIPYFRGDRANLRVVGVQPVANLWQVFNDPPPQQGESLMAYVEYVEQGRAIEEEFYGVYEWVPTQSGALNWGFGRLICFRAERGRLDDLRETFWQIAGSLQPNPQWRARCQQITQQLQAGFDAYIGGIKRKLDAEKEFGRRIIAYNDQLIQQRNDQVDASIARQRQLNHERAAYNYTAQDAFNDALIGRTAYIDPNSASGNYHYEHDGNNTYVYTDGQGNWYSTPDPLDNPNDHRNGNWTLARQVTPNS
ncbi:MAG TPA: hypothetical protein VF525_07730 [Pyrinomonadaceae bacterium]|jgi:hypothetical protein